MNKQVSIVLENKQLCLNFSRRELYWKNIQPSGILIFLSDEIFILVLGNKYIKHQEENLIDVIACLTFRLVN